MPAAFDGRSLGEAVPANAGYVVLAVRAEGGWQFNPSADYRLRSGNVLVAMATPQGRRMLESTLAA